MEKFIVLRKIGTSVDMVRSFPKEPDAKKFKELMQLSETKSIITYHVAKLIDEEQA